MADPPSDKHIPQNLMAEKVPSWFDLRDSDYYQNLPEEERLRTFDGWQEMKEQELLNGDLSTQQALRFYAANDAIRDEIEQGREGQTDLGEAMEGIMSRRAQDREYLMSKARQTMFTDRAIRKHIRGEKPDESGDYLFPQGLNFPMRRKVGDRELTWLDSITEPNKAPSGNFQWTTRVTDLPVDPEAEINPEARSARMYEVNPALALLGFKAFRDAVMAGEGTNREKISAIANFHVYRSVALADLEEYSLSKRIKVAGKGLGNYMAGAGARPSPQEIARIQASRQYAADDEDGEIDYGVSMFLSKPDVFKIRKGEKEIPSGKPLAEEIAHYYLKKRGLADIDELVGNDPELQAQLAGAYRDALLDNPDVWADDVMTLKDSEGNIMPNPKLISEGSAEQIAGAMEEAGASKDEIASAQASAAHYQEAQAAHVIEALFSGVEDRKDAGIAFATSETLMRTHMQDFRRFFYLNKDKGWTAKEMLDSYMDFTRDPGFKGLMTRLKYNKSPLGWIGTILQSWNSAEKDGAFGNSAEAVGTLLRGIEESAPQGIGKLGLGVYAFVGGGIEKGVGLLGGDLDIGAENMRERRQAIGEALSTADSIYGKSGRYSRMIGEEIGIIALTMGASVPANMLRKGGTNAWRGLQGSRLDQATKVLEDTSGLIAKRMRRFSISAQPVAAGTTGAESLSRAFARRGYFGLQASRSAEATYAESYDKWYEAATLSGLSPEDAKEQADGRAYLSGVGAGLITGTMMKLIPGGTERLFERGSRMTFSQMSRELGITKEMLARAIQNDRFHKEAGELLIKEFGLIGRGAGREAVEEFMDEFAQGILAQATFDPDRTFKDILHVAFEAAAVGGLMGGGVTAATRGREPALNEAAIEKLESLRDLARRISKDLPKASKQLYTEADKKEKSLRGQDDAITPRKEDDLLEPQEGEALHFITNDGRQGQGVWHRNKVYEPVEEQDVLEGVEEQENVVELGGVKMAPINEALARMASSAEGLGVGEENPLVTDARRGYEERMESIKENEKMSDEDKAKEMASVYEEAQNDITLKGTASLVVFEANYKPMVDRYSKKSDSVSASGTSQVDSFVSEYEMTEEAIQQGIVDGTIPADQGERSRTRSRQGVHEAIEANFGADPLLTETMKTAADLAFAALQLTRNSYSSSGEIEDTGKTTGTLADNKSAKRVKQFMEGLEQISSDIASGKSGRRALAEHIASFYKWSALKLQRNSGQNYDAMVGLLGSGDPVIDRLQGFILKGEELSKNPLKLPSFRFDDMTAVDTANTTYLHNIVERNNAVDLTPEEEAELAEEIAAAQQQKAEEEEWTEEDLEAAVFLQDLFNELHESVPEGEVIELDAFLKAASERKFTDNAELISEVYNIGVVQRFEPALAEEIKGAAPRVDVDPGSQPESESEPEAEEISPVEDDLSTPEPAVDTKKVEQLAEEQQELNLDEPLGFSEFAEFVREENDITELTGVQMWRAYQKGVSNAYDKAFDQIEALVESEQITSEQAGAAVDAIKAKGLPSEEQMGDDLQQAGFTEEATAEAEPEEATAEEAAPDVEVTPTEDTEETSEIIATEDTTEDLTPEGVVTIGGVTPEEFVTVLTETEGNRKSGKTWVLAPKNIADKLSRLPEQVAEIVETWFEDKKSGGTKSGNIWISGNVGDSVLVREDARYMAINPFTGEADKKTAAGEFAGPQGEMQPGQRTPLPPGMIMIEDAIIMGNNSLTIHFNPELAPATPEAEALPEAEETSEVVDVEAVEVKEAAPEPSKKKAPAKKKAEAKPNPDAYTVEEIEEKKAEIAAEREGEAAGVYVTPADFTKKGRPLRKNRLRKHEQEVVDEANREIIEKYPLAPEGETVTLSAPSGRLRSIRNRQPKRVDISDETELADQLDAARRYARPNGFSNSPFHMAVELSEDNAQPVPVPAFFLQNPDKINPGLILNKAGTHVIGARTSFKDSNGKFETVMLAEEGGKARTLYEIADLQVDESLREKNKKAAQKQAFRQKEMTSGAVAVFSQTSAEVFSQEELGWLNETTALDLPIILYRRIQEQFKGTAGDALTEIQNRVLGKAVLSILKTRIARAVEDTSDAKAVNEYYRNNYVHNFMGKPEADVKGFQLLVDAYFDGDASKLFGPNSRPDLRLMDPKVQVEGESHWDSIYGIISTERSTPGRRNKGVNNPDADGPRFVSSDNSGEEAVHRASEGKMPPEEEEFFNPSRISEETDAEFTEEERAVMAKADEELQEDNPELFDQEGEMDMSDEYDPTEDNMSLPKKTPKLTAEQREVRRQVRRQIRELGLKDGDSDSIRTALLTIKNNKRYPKHYREIVKRLLKSDQLDLSTLELQIRAEEQAAGLFVAQEEGKPDIIMISDTVSNPRGHHDVVVHELIHAVFDRMVTNPTTAKQKQVVKAIDAYMDRARQYIGKLERSREGVDQWMRLVALREAENYSLERIDMMFLRSKSPIASEYRANMSEDAKRDLFRRLREEDHGVFASYNEILQTRYALGIKADGSLMDQEYSRREFITHLLTDEHFQWFLKQVDSETKGGSIWVKALRTKWWGLTGQPATNANAALLDGILTFKGDSPYKNARHQKMVNMLAGLSPEQKQNATDFRDNTPAYQGSKPSAAYLRKNAVAPDVTHKSLGLRPRQFIGGFSAWVLPDGRVIEVNDSHAQTAKDAGMKGERTAMDAGWVRLNIVDGAAMYSGRPNLPRKARATIEDWAAFNGTWAEYDPDQYQDADDSMDWQFSLPAETSAEAATWARVREDSPTRKAARLMGVRIQPTDVKEPTVGSDATVFVPVKGDIDETALTEKIVQASFSAAIPPGSREQARKYMVQFEEMAVEVETAGSYDRLVSSMVTESMTGESTHTGGNVGRLRQQILSGAYGQAAQRQLNTVLRAAEASYPKGTRSFQRENGQDEIYNVGNRVMAERAKVELGLELVGNDELSFYEEMAESANMSLRDFTQDAFSANPEIRREVQASMEFRRRESNTMANTESDEGLAALLTDYLAQRSMQASIPMWNFRKDPALKGKLTEDQDINALEVLEELEIPTIEALRKRGVNVDRLKQAFTVEGRMGKKAHAMHMELKGKISKIREEALFHDDKIRNLLETTLGSRSIDELLQSKDKNVRKRAEQVNLVLGTVNDEDIVDEMFPGNSHLPGGLTRRQQLWKDKEKSTKTIASKLGKEYARATRLEKRGQPGDFQQAAAIRGRAKEDARKDAQVINDAFWKDLTDLTKLAATRFRSKQKAAGVDLFQFNRDLFRAVKDMRTTINRIQQEILNSPILDRAGGSDTAFLRNLRVKIGATEGIYLSRSYQALDEKGWSDFLETFHPEAQIRMQEAHRYFREELTKKEARKLMRQDPNLTEGQARAMIAVTKRVTSDMVVAKVKDFLTNTLKVEAGAPGMALGQLNTKVLQPRKEIPKELRELAGQYKDNVYNASQTLLRLGSMMANENFLQGIHDTLTKAQADAKARGSKAMFISDKPGPGLKRFVDDTTTRMGGAESYGPLASKYGPRELVDALHDMRPSELGTLHRAFLNYASFTMGNMTTRRLRTHIRNFLGNPMLLVNAGMPFTAMSHLGGAMLSGANFGPGGTMMRNFFRGGKVEGAKDAIRSKLPPSLQGILPEEGETFSKEALELIGEYAEENITGTDVHINQREEIRRELGNAGMADPANGFFFPGVMTPGRIPNAVKKWVQGGDAKLTKLYQMGDDWWKVVAYENQLESLARAFGLVKSHRGRLIGKAIKPKELRNLLGTIDNDGVYRGPMTDAQADQILKDVGLKDFGLFRKIGDSFKGTTTDRKTIEESVSTPEHEALLQKDKKAAALKALRRAAAYRVRKTLPNYGATVEFVRSLKKHGVTAMAAPFISFRAEIARIMFDTPTLALREIRSNNNGVKMMGWKRIVGSLFTMTTSPYAAMWMAKHLYGLVEGMLGDDDEEMSVAIPNDGAFSAEQDVKRFISQYFRDGTIAVLDQAADGTVTWMDLSYMLPHSTVVDPITQFANSFLDPTKNPVTELQNSSLDLIKPYVAPQLWMSALAEGAKDSDSLTGQIDPNPMISVIKNVWNPLTNISIPGTLTDFGTLASAALAGGETYKNGRKLSVKEELTSQLLGTKIVQTDMADRFKRNLGMWGATRMEAQMKFTSPVGNQTTFKESDLEDLLDEATRLDRLAVANAHRDYLAASSRLPAGMAAQILSESELSKEFKAMIQTGYYVPFVPTKGAIKRAVESAEAIGNPGRGKFMLKKVAERRGQAEPIFPELDYENE